MSGNWKLILLLTFSGCTGSAVQLSDRPSKADVISGARVNGGDLLIAAAYTGGGGGDKTYRLLACPSRMNKCDVMAGIDTHSDRVPKLTLARNVKLGICESDTVWNFSNVTNFLETADQIRVSVEYLGAECNGQN